MRLLGYEIKIKMGNKTPEQVLELIAQDIESRSSFINTSGDTFKEDFEKFYTLYKIVKKMEKVDSVFIQVDTELCQELYEFFNMKKTIDNLVLLGDHYFDRFSTKVEIVKNDIGMDTLEFTKKL